METAFRCSYCGCNLPKPKNTCGTGYGIDGDNNKVCYVCCAYEDKLQMEETGKIHLYYGTKEVTNWPGSLRFNIRYQYSQPVPLWGHSEFKRVDFYFYDDAGNRWHGFCCNTDYNQWSYCHKLKTKEQPYVYPKHHEC